MDAVQYRMAPSVSRRVGVVLAWVLAVGVAMAIPQRSQAVDLPVSDPQVKIPSGASLEQVVQAFKDATSLPCIAEKPTSERHTGQPFTGLMSAAVRFVSETLDYHVQPRSGVLRFYRQYSFPADRPVLLVKDLAALTDDLYRLVHVFKQPSVTGDMNGDQEALIASFNAAQIQQLQGDGLPVTALPPAQARLWFAINSAFIYEGADSRLADLAGCFKHWSQCEISSYQGRQGDDKRLAVRYPQIGAPGGYKQCILPEAAGGPMRVARHRDGNIALPSRPNRLPARFDKKVELPTGPATLRSLFEVVHTGTGFDIQLPNSASRYSFVTSGGSLKARDLVDGLTEMIGRRCDPDAKGHYTLARPRYGVARTPAELHQAVEALVPPCLTLLSTQSMGSAMLWKRGQVDAVKAAYDPAALAAGVKVTDLPADLQERVGQALTLDLIAPLFMGRSLLSPAAPPGYMLTPGRCILHMGMGGKPIPGNRPAAVSTAQFVSVTVPRPTGGTDQWGWVSGTAHVQP